MIYWAQKSHSTASESRLQAVRPVTGPSYSGVILFASNGLRWLYQFGGSGRCHIDRPTADLGLDLAIVAHLPTSECPVDSPVQVIDHAQAGLPLGHLRLHRDAGRDLSLPLLLELPDSLLDGFHKGACRLREPRLAK